MGEMKLRHAAQKMKIILTEMREAYKPEKDRNVANRLFIAGRANSSDAKMERIYASITLRSNRKPRTKSDRKTN